MVKNVFNALKKRLEEIEGLKAFWYRRGRLEQGDTDELFYVPSVHIEFMQLQEKQFSGGVTYFDVSIRLHLATESLNENEDEESLDNLDLLDDVCDKMAKWYCKKSYLSGIPADDQILINNIKRISITVDHEPSNLVIPVIEFNFIAYDLGRIDLGTKIDVTVDPIVSVE